MACVSLIINPTTLPSSRLICIWKMSISSYEISELNFVELNQIGLYAVMISKMYPGIVCVGITVKVIVQQIWFHLCSCTWHPGLHVLQDPRCIIKNVAQTKDIKKVFFLNLIELNTTGETVIMLCTDLWEIAYCHKKINVVIFSS